MIDSLSAASTAFFRRSAFCVREVQRFLHEVVGGLDAILERRVGVGLAQEREAIAHADVVVVVARHVLERGPRAHLAGVAAGAPTTSGVGTAPVTAPPAAAPPPPAPRPPPAAPPPAAPAPRRQPRRARRPPPPRPAVVERVPAVLRLDVLRDERKPLVLHDLHDLVARVRIERRASTSGSSRAADPSDVCRSKPTCGS